MPRPRTGISSDASWQDSAACGGLHPDIFFPEDHDSVLVAKAICEQCSVRSPCLEYAIANREKHGIWGGTTEHERKRIGTARRKRAA